jgi:hypothetical protein
MEKHNYGMEPHNSNPAAGRHSPFQCIRLARSRNLITACARHSITESLMQLESVVRFTLA